MPQQPFATEVSELTKLTTAQKQQSKSELCDIEITPLKCLDTMILS